MAHGANSTDPPDVAPPHIFMLSESSAARVTAYCGLHPSGTLVASLRRYLGFHEKAHFVKAAVAATLLRFLD